MTPFGRQIRAAAIGIVVAAVLAGGVLAVGRVITAPAERATSSTAPTTSTTPGPTTTTASPSSPAPIVRKLEPNRTFASASGNIQCSIGEFGGQPGAICQQQHVKYAVPAESCPGNSRASVGVGPDGGYWPCVSVDYLADEVLPYDTPLTVSGVTCSISLATGVRCTNASGKGFTMEYAAGISFF
jgi:hypothetical protein